ncbi:MFS transporter [Roseomonas harenae]|uniref:MFS transporter n=1 Tax=Muricoccus harenae TaxID=2692566 RepID=UPI00133191CB|nr:MFS transporter [Roseomonas harenae]
MLSSREFRRLWALGAITNAMRWVEMLAAALFTFEVTGSGVAVAFVSAARTLPLLCLGAIAGVVCEAINRKHILLGGMLLSCAAALSICLLDLLGWVRPWHIALAAFLSGSVWATEMATRRRMVGEAAGAGLVSQAVALDSLTGSFARMAGPLAGSMLFAWFGLLGAFAISSGCYLLAALLVPGIRHVQETRHLELARIPGDLAESLAFALRQPTVLAVLGVTATMNFFAFSYVALVAPLARTVFGVPEAMVGLLAAGEPLGGLLGGLLLTSRAPKTKLRTLMIAGSAIFLVTLAVMPLMPSYALACGLLVGGGLGLALFSNMQTTLVLTNVPASHRSRQMGLVTMCIGLGPLGQMLIGGLAEMFGPSRAVIITALAGLTALGLVSLLCMRSRAKPEDAID